MRPALRQRLSVLIPALACAMCLGSAFAVSHNLPRPLTRVETKGASAEAEASNSQLRFASPATLVLGVLGFAAMLRKPVE